MKRTGKIVSDLPGRIRIRFGADAFTKNKGYGLEKYLKGYPFVSYAKCNASTGGILIEYHANERDAVLSLIRGIRLQEIPEAERDLGDTSELTDRFVDKLVKRTVMKFVVAPLLPPFVRVGMTLWQYFPIFKKGLESLKNASMDVDLLDAVSVGAGIATRDFRSASNILFFLSISSMLEEYVTTKVKSELTDSLRINVDQVWLTSEEGEADRQIPFDELTIGQCIRVHTGNMIPVDGQVVEGLAFIDESSMTGESEFVEKKPGSFVFAGTVIADGNIVVRVGSLGKSTRINGIIDLIDSAGAGKSAQQTKAEMFANSIVPYNFLLTGLVALFTRNLTKTMATLMVDYSCAIKLATPLATIAAIKEASDASVMIKGGKYLENLAETDLIVFDKTGTLTKAEPALIKYKSFMEPSDDEMLRIAACIEEHFPHSVSKAIVRCAHEKGLTHDEMHGEVKYILAHGIRSSLDGKDVVIGSNHFVFEDEKVSMTDLQRTEMEEFIKDYSTVYMGIDGRLAAVFCVDDPLRPEAESALRELKESGVQTIAMLTGDSEHIADRIAAQLHIDEIRARVLPDEKAQFLKEWKRTHRKVAMVGDGINDSPALSMADVSIAMRDASDIAREVSDIVLLRSDLAQINKLRELAQHMNVRIQRHMKFILTFNSLLLAGGIFGVLTPTAAAFLHNASTLAVSLDASKKYYVM